MSCSFVRVKAVGLWQVTAEDFLAFDRCPVEGWSKKNKIGWLGRGQLRVHCGCIAGTLNMRQNSMVNDCDEMDGYKDTTTSRAKGEMGRYKSWDHTPESSLLLVRKPSFAS